MVSRSTVVRIAMRSLATSILRGLPPMLPLARAAVRPARVRSMINSWSDSASAAKMPKTRRPLAVAVSISSPAPASTRRPIRRAQLAHGSHQTFQVASGPFLLNHVEALGLAFYVARGSPLGDKGFGSGAYFVPGQPHGTKLCAVPTRPLKELLTEFT